jgi:NitT/TauT family transport system substrate-binding protein
MPDQHSRRNFLSNSAGLLGGALILARTHYARAATPVTIQLDWLMSNGQIGDVVALQKGYFAEEGIEVTFSPGGPNAQTVPPVASGVAQLGQFSDTGQASIARGNGIPLQVIATGFRSTPFAYYSLPRAPIRTVEDMVGKRIGTQPTARFVLDILLKKYEIDPAQLEIVMIGFDMAPLVTGQVDAVTGWITNTAALSVIGPERIDLMMQDAGLPTMANAYFAMQDTVEGDPETLAKYIRGAARGWGWAYENRKEAIDILVDAYPNLDRAIEQQTVDTVMKLSFDADTQAHGWGWFDVAKIAEQIRLFDAVKQYEQGAPAAEELMNPAILELTADARPKLG